MAIIVVTLAPSPSLQNNHANCGANLRCLGSFTQAIIETHDCAMGAWVSVHEVVVRVSLGKRAENLETPSYGVPRSTGTSLGSTPLK
jgi:hypothetical protein